MTRDPRHTAIDLFERELARAGCDTSPALACHLLAVLEGHQLRITEAHAVEPADWRHTGRTSEPTPEYLAARKAMNSTPATGAGTTG